MVLQQFPKKQNKYSLYFTYLFLALSFFEFLFALELFCTQDVCVYHVPVCNVLSSLSQLVIM